MIDMKLWKKRMTDDIIDASRQKILANNFAAEAAQKLNIAPIKIFIESRPHITMERKGDNCLIPWKRNPALKGKYLSLCSGICSMVGLHISIAMARLAIRNHIQTGAQKPLNIYPSLT